MERIFPSGERFILRCAARNVITAEWNAARAGNVISRSEYGKLRRHWETSRIFFPGKTCSTRRLLHFFGESAFPFSFSFFFPRPRPLHPHPPPIFSLFNVLPFVLEPVTVPPLCPRHKRVYAYKSSLFTPRIELKLNFFLRPREGEAQVGRIGAVCAPFLSFPRPSHVRMESRSDTGGNRVEIQESASLQLGSDVTKFRVAAAEVDRHFVSSCERRETRVREYHMSRMQSDISRHAEPFPLCLPYRDRNLRRDCGTIAKFILLLRGKLKFLTAILSWRSL